MFVSSTSWQTGFELKLHAPPVQFVNVAPVAGTAVSVTGVPGGRYSPAGDCVIVPGPSTLVSSWNPPNAAETDVFAVMTSVQVTGVTFTHAPPHAVNDEPLLGTAVKVTVVLFANDVPAGLTVIVPGPVVLVVSVYFVTLVTPVPVSEPPAKLPSGPLMLSVAARAPRACGAKVTVIEQDDPTAMGADRQLFVCEKSPGFEPAMEIEETVMGPVPVEPFWSVKVSGDDEPVAVSGKRIGFGAIRTGSGFGVGGATDVAEIENVRVPTLETIVSVPVKVPIDVGVKFNPAMQEPPDATVEVQLLAATRLGSPVTVTFVIVSGP
jgi:hypothetical protein